MIPCCHLVCSHALPGEISRANFKMCGSGCRVVLQASPCYAGGIILHPNFFWQMQRSRGDCSIRCDRLHHVQLASAALPLAICSSCCITIAGWMAQGSFDHYFMALPGCPYTCAAWQAGILLSQTMSRREHCCRCMAVAKVLHCARAAPANACTLVYSVWSLG